MKKIALYAAVAVIVIALSGCAASVDGGGAAKIAASSETSAPQLTAEPSSPEAVLLESVQAIEGMSSATLESTLPVAKDVCARLAAGSAPADLNPIENGDVMQNLGFVFVAVDTLCSEYSEAASAAYMDGQKSLDGQ